MLCLLPRPTGLLKTGLLAGSYATACARQSILSVVIAAVWGDGRPGRALVVEPCRQQRRIAQVPQE